MKKLLIFVAEWCPFCQRTKPAIYGLFDKYGSDNIELYEDSSDEYKALAEKLGVNGIPTYVVVDEEGNEVEREGGAKEPSELEAFYLEKVGAAVPSEPIVEEVIAEEAPKPKKRTAKKKA